MTASAKGTAEKPANKVKQKAGLNRAILDTAPGSFINNLLVKAEEAGRCQVMLLNTRKHRPSKTSPECRAVRTKELDEREHHCGCGFAATRDQASALSMLVDGLRLGNRALSREAQKLHPEPRSGLGGVVHRCTPIAAVRPPSTGSTAPVR